MLNNICIYHYRQKNRFLEPNFCFYCHSLHFIRYGHYFRKPPINHYWVIKAAGLTSIHIDFSDLEKDGYISIQRYFCKDCHRTFSDKLPHSAYYRWYMLITIVCVVYLHIVKHISVYQIHQHTKIGIRTLKSWIKKNTYAEAFIGEFNHIRATEHHVSTLFELHHYPIVSQVIETFATGVVINGENEYERLFHLYLIMFSFYHHIAANAQTKPIVV